MKPLIGVGIALGFLLNTQMVQANSTFQEVGGQYDVRLTIGTRVFDDLLVINQVTSGPIFRDDLGEISGTFTVPGIFKVPLENGSVYLISKSAKDLSLQFRITADEGGQRYPVFFYLTTTEGTTCLMSGRAYLDEQSQKLLGTMTVTNKDSRCSQRGSFDERRD